LLISAAVSDPIGSAFALAILAALLRIPDWLFRSRIDWGMQAAALLMIPAFCISFAAAVFIWFVAETGQFEVSWAAIAAIAAWALWLSNWSASGMKSRQSAGAFAFRKRLAAGRIFLMRELEKPQPDLRDSWYPWLIAFGLGRQVDYWSSRNASAEATTDSLTSSDSTTHTSSSGAAAATGWSGGVGLSGGAGATGMWAAAAAGMAAGVATPGSSSDGGGSSSGGSSGGGGGGGW
jgi:hypothetical protein